MNDIDPIGGMASSATLRAFAQQTQPRSTGTEAAPTRQDSVEISELASFLSRLAELPEARARRIVEVRNAIAAGAYQTPEKLDIATDRLLQAL